MSNFQTFDKHLRKVNIAEQSSQNESDVSWISENHVNINSIYLKANANPKRSDLDRRSKFIYKVQTFEKQLFSSKTYCLSVEKPGVEKLLEDECVSTYRSI